MGSLGIPEILLILVLALLVFGPKRLPEIGRTLGKGLAEFRKASNDLKRTINAELALDEDTKNLLTRRPETPLSVSSLVQSWMPADEPAKPAVTTAAAVITPVALPAASPEDSSRENLEELDTITGTVARDAAHPSHEPVVQVSQAAPAAPAAPHAAHEPAPAAAPPAAPGEPT